MLFGKYYSFPVCSSVCVCCVFWHINTYKIEFHLSEAIYRPKCKSNWDEFLETKLFFALRRPFWCFSFSCHFYFGVKCLRGRNSAARTESVETITTQDGTTIRKHLKYRAYFFLSIWHSPKYNNNKKRGKKH